MKLKGQVLNLISPLCAKAINKVWNYNRALVQNLQTWFSKATYLSSLQTHACVTHDAFYTFTQAQSCMSSLPTKAVLAQHVVAENNLSSLAPLGQTGTRFVPLTAFLTWLHWFLSLSLCLSKDKPSLNSGTFI